MSAVIIKSFHYPTRALFAIITVLVVLLSSSSTTYALSDAQKQAFESGVLYFNVGDQCSANLSGSGPILGPFFPQISDTSQLTKNIQQYIQDTLPSSPLLALSSTFVSLGQKYNVNPALILAMTQKETSLGTTGYGKPPKYNVGNIRGSGDGTGFASYDSYQTGIEAMYKNLRTGLYLAPPASETTVAQVINTWAPPSENDTSAYIAFVLDAMSKIYTGITESGASNPSSGASTASFTPGTTSDSQCQATSSYQAGANGYNLSGPNAMAHYYQCDPQWANQPYGYNSDGSPKSSICAGGCGITSLAMVVATLSNSDVTPSTLAKQYGNTYHTDGTSWGLWPVAANDYSLKYQDLGVDFNKAASIIRQGGLVIISVNAGYFTSGSHLMVLRAVDNQGNFYLADPNGPNNPRQDENKPFSADFLRVQGNAIGLFGFTK